MKTTYTYYYRLRPPGPGCQPSGSIAIVFEDTIIEGRHYWGSVTYNRPLTEQEKYSYDLDEYK